MASSVLVVDDDATFRLFARRALTSWGHVVVGEAGSAAEAIQRTSELRPDTVLADLGLPDGDGFTLTRDLLALPCPPRVVLISSDDDVANSSAAVARRRRGLRAEGRTWRRADEAPDRG